MTRPLNFLMSCFGICLLARCHHSPRLLKFCGGTQAMMVQFVQLSTADQVSLAKGHNRQRCDAVSGTFLHRLHRGWCSQPLFARLLAVRIYLGLRVKIRAKNLHLFSFCAFPILLLFGHCLLPWNCMRQADFDEYSPFGVRIHTMSSGVFGSRLMCCIFVQRAMYSCSRSAVCNLLTEWIQLLFCNWL